MAAMILSSLICDGSGSWTRMPWTASSLLNFSMMSSSSASVVDSGMRQSKDAMPASAQAFSFAVTYDFVADEYHREPWRDAASPLEFSDLVLYFGPHACGHLFAVDDCCHGY